MQKRLIIAFVAILGIIFGAEYNTLQDYTNSTEAPSTETRVVSVIDGDTIIVKTPSGEETVRLIGIDTPEVDPTRGGPECYGAEASDFTKNLLADSFVTLEADASQGDRDSYGRLLRFVYTNDGTHVNQILLEKGFATEYTYNKPYRYQKEFRSAAALAREGQVGVWGTCGR